MLANSRVVIKLVLCAKGECMDDVTKVVLLLLAVLEVVYDVVGVDVIPREGAPRGKVKVADDLVDVDLTRYSASLLVLSLDLLRLPFLNALKEEAIETRPSAHFPYIPPKCMD
jgi:hypothetical protein